MRKKNADRKRKRGYIYIRIILILYLASMGGYGVLMALSPGRTETEQVSDQEPRTTSTDIPLTPLPDVPYDSENDTLNPSETGLQPPETDSIQNAETNDSQNQDTNDLDTDDSQTWTIDKKNGTKTIVTHGSNTTITQTTESGASQNKTKNESSTSQDLGDNASENLQTNSTYNISQNPGTAKKRESANLEGGVTVIGDSIFLSSASAFKKLQKDVVIDAKVSRQATVGLSVAKALKKADKLRPTVIISLGTNGRFPLSVGQTLIDFIGAGRTIYWVDAYGKKLASQNDVNNTIQNLADKNPNVHRIHWAAEAGSHPEWFYPDGIHPNARGQKAFARIVYTSIQRG